MSVFGTSTTGAPVGPTGAAIDFVNQGWTYFEGKSNYFTSQALALISNLQNVPGIEPVSFNVDFPEISGLTSFVAPVKPTLPTITFEAPQMVGAPEINIPAPDAFTTAPVFDVQEPNPVALPTQPGDFNVAAPSAAPQLTELTLPAAPVITLPELPELLGITLPEIPALEFAAFAGRDPGDAPTLPDLSDVGFTEQAYSREMLNDVMPRVRQALAGNTVLAASVEQALFARANERNARTNRKARQEVAESFRARGFTEPVGAERAAMAEQSYTELASSNEINRELSIERYQQEVKDVQFAITQGIALEQVLIGQHAGIMERSIQGAKLMLDARVALHNAAVAGYNASIERFKADADVFRTVIESEVAKIEAYKAQVDGQRAIAEVNKAAADAYDSRVRGLLGLVEIYKAEVDAVATQAQIEKLKIESHQSEVQAYAEQARAYSARWDGFRAAVDAQQAGFKTYEIGVQAWNARLEGWSKGEQIKVSRHDSSIKSAQLGIDLHRSRVQEVLGRLQLEEGRVRALSVNSEAIARMYAAEAQVETARNDANTRAFEAATSYHSARVQAQVQEAQIKIQDASRVLSAQIEAMRGAAQALSQLAASAMSAVNFSAGVSGSGSESASYGYSVSKSKGWSWQGETASDPTPDF